MDFDVNEAAQWAAEALDLWGDQEDAAAITCDPADVTMHREREGAFRDGAKRFRKLISSS